MTKKKMLFLLYALVLVALFLYTFTQVDLSLTFSRMPLLRSLVNSFKYIGYFQRPLSTEIYLTILSLLFIFYGIFLYLAHKGILTKKEAWRLILFASVLLLFSYNAFSYDLFNYIFDAKIVTHYHQNPYMHKALDYPGDPMLTFMRWTHRVYPYGPVWLGLTIPLSFIGLQFFIPTFFFFKLLMTASFVGSAYFIGKIFQKINPKAETLGLVFFGLQPLLLIESVVSAHIDIVMFVFALWATYLLLSKRFVRSGVMLLLSIGIKFATIFLVPVYYLIFRYEKRRKPVPWRWIFFFATILMTFTAILQTTQPSFKLEYLSNPAKFFQTIQPTFQPWYLIGPLVFAAFLADWLYVVVVSVIISFFAMLTYAPYLYLGNWDPPVPHLLATFYTISYILSAIAIVILLFSFKKARKINDRT